jgi:hypothetical protein
MKTIFYYSVSVKYNEGYFENPKTPLNVVLGFSSTKEQTVDSIQKVYTNAKVLSIKKITQKKFLTF